MGKIVKKTYKPEKTFCKSAETMIATVASIIVSLVISNFLSDSDSPEMRMNLIVVTTTILTSAYTGIKNWLNHRKDYETVEE